MKDKQLMIAYFRQLRPHPSTRGKRGAMHMLCCASLLVLLGASAIRATPLETYRQQVQQSVTALESLPQWKKKVESQADYTRRVAEVFAGLRETVLPIQTIEWNGVSISPDNKWLAEALSQYEQLPVSNLAGREAALVQITERLRAINERLTELVGTAQGAGKDAEKKKLDAILQRPEYNNKKEEGGALARLWRALLELWQRFVHWLRSLFSSNENLEPGTPGTSSRLAQIIIIGLALAVIGYILWKFAPLFRRALDSRKREKPEARVVLGERVEADQTSADLLAEAERLARAGDLRAAIRKGYIALLCELGDRKVIGLAQHKTNRDYLRAVRQIEPLHGQMQQLTLSFENHWYGFVPATENDWDSFRASYHQALGST